MSSPKTSRTTRRLLQLASLGLAGLLAGLLSGCTSTPANSNFATYTQPSSLNFSSTPTYQPGSLYTHPLPDLRHAPIPHRIESWADRTPRQASSSPFTGQINTDATLTNYAFTGTRASSNPGTGHLMAQ
jgi:hypothetical protein